MKFSKKAFKLMMPVIFYATLVFAYHDLGYQYLYPTPGAPRIPREAHLIIRLNEIPANTITNLQTFVTVSGQSGRQYRGNCAIASDKKTIIFKPDNRFQLGDKVTVTLAPQTKSTAIQSYSYTFMVSPSEALSPIYDPTPEKAASLEKRQSVSSPQAQEAMVMPNGVSVPSNFPHVHITINDNPDDEYIFIDNRGGNGTPYTIIFDNTGSPVWYWQTPDERRDFKVQRNGWATMIIRHGYEEFGGEGQGFLALDNHYQPVKTFYATNGYYTDEHELQVLEDGGYLIIGRRNETIDMSQYVDGGKKNATVMETCIQEYTADDELIFQWAAWDHLDIRDIQVSDPTSSSMYFSHMNSIDIDDDGHIIVSNRELSEITKINRQTGDIIWRLGGKHNQFTFINDPLQGTRNQHAARVLGNNQYSIFDNGNGHNPQITRAVKYKLDTDKMTATLIWQFRDNPDKFSHYMGNAQPLPNGNTLINYAVGDLPKLTEVRPDGSKAFEMNFVDRYECYRVHRCTWNGICNVPRLQIEEYPDNLTLLFNKFGDPDVEYYRIYAGNRQNPTTVIDTSHVTMKKIDYLTNGYYWIRVTAVNAAGEESDFSNEEAVYVSFHDPGANIVNNGDFSQGEEHWSWQVQGPGQAAWSIEDGEAHIAITNGGSDDTDIQLAQNSLSLINGKSYTFEFDARADNERLISAHVGMQQSPFINYSKSTYFILKSRSMHFSWDFKMQDLSDFNARIVFNLGNDAADVYLDNISVKENTGQQSYNSANFTIPGLIECEEYDLGGEGIAFHDDDIKEGVADYRPDDNVDCQSTSDDGGGYNIGWTVQDEWLEYTVDVESGIYDIEYRTASEPGGCVLRVLLNDVNLAEFDVPPTGGWQEWTTLKKSGVQIQGGKNLIMRLEIVSGSQNMNWLKFTRIDNSVNENYDLPQDYYLSSNYPNPFNPGTSIRYQLPENASVSITIYNATGQKVRTLMDAAPVAPGFHQATWDGRNEPGMTVPSGIYFCRFEACSATNSFQKTIKMTAIK